MRLEVADGLTDDVAIGDLVSTGEPPADVPQPLISNATATIRSRARSLVTES
jgi:hypothetical protein